MKKNNISSYRVILGMPGGMPGGFPGGAGAAPSGPPAEEDEGPKIEEVD